MCLNPRIAIAVLASLSLGAALVAYAADQNSPVQPSNGQPGQTQAGQTQPGQAQPGQTQPGQMQPGTNQRIPYQANRMPTGAGQTAENGRREDVDLFLIPCLIGANDGEVTLAKIAEQRAQSPEVKNFAQELIKDHSAAAKEFEQLQAKLTQQLRPENPNNTPVAATLFKINEEVQQTCLANAQRQLEQESGAEFDRWYTGMQVGMHEQLVGALSVFKNHATSPDFRKAVDELSQVATRHLDQAKNVEKGLMEHPQVAQHQPNQPQQPNEAQQPNQPQQR